MHCRLLPHMVVAVQRHSPVPVLHVPRPLQSALLVQRRQRPVVAWHALGLQAPMSVFHRTRAGHQRSDRTQPAPRPFQHRALDSSSRHSAL